MKKHARQGPAGIKTVVSQVLLVTPTWYCHHIAVAYAASGGIALLKEAYARTDGRHQSCSYSKILIEYLP